MASKLLDAMFQEGSYAIGTVNSWKARVLANGAKVDETVIENFTFVEVYYNVDGERCCKYLTSATKNAYLIDGVERRLEDEPLNNFYNAKDELARLWILERGFRFESSKISKNAGVTDIKKGMVAHWDATSKTYLISDASAPHANYATAIIKLEVVEVETELGYNYTSPVIRFEVI